MTPEMRQYISVLTRNQFGNSFNYATNTFEQFNNYKGFVNCNFSVFLQIKFLLPNFCNAFNSRKCHRK